LLFFRIAVRVVLVVGPVENAEMPNSPGEPMSVAVPLGEGATRFK
jgi:hypothetical protein